MGSIVFSQTPVRERLGEAGMRRSSDSTERIKPDSSERIITDSAAASHRDTSFGPLHNLASRQNVELRDTLDSAARAQMFDTWKKDSIRVADSLHRRDSMDLLRKSSLERPAFTSAADSIVEDFSNGNRKIYYYGPTTVKYQNMELTANYMVYDMATSEVFARGVLDSISGEWKGKPEMKQGRDSYKMDELRYNFNSRKARITNMDTKDDEGVIHGKKIKMMPDRSINMDGGQYAVCELDDPHFYLNLTYAKVITKPSKKTVFGPAWPVIAGIPVPIGLPYGFIPEKPQRSTGMLMPTFGEETARGFYARDAGMYFVFGDYLDLSVTGDYYTLGSWALDFNSRYKVNYKFNGSFSLNMSKDITGEKGGIDYSESSNFGLKWSHSQDSKAHPGTSFSASVNFSSPSNNRYNSHSVNEAVQSQASSSVSYSKNWNGKFNMSISGQHSQNNRDSSYTFTLPNVSFSMSTIYPFKQKNRVGKEKPYEKISFGYNTSLQNKASFKMSEFMGYNIDPVTGEYEIDPVTGYRVKQFSVDSLKSKLPNKFKNGMNHNFSIGLPNFQLFKYISVNPSVSYSQVWFFSQGDKHLVDATDKQGNPVYVTTEDGSQVRAQKVETDNGAAFNGFGISQNYSGSVSASTRIYGMFNFGKSSYLQAIRHVVSPSMSISLSPEKGNPGMNGWRVLDNYYDASGKLHTPETDNSMYYNIYSTSSYNSSSPTGRGKSATASLSIGNNLEAKVMDRADTSGKATKKVKILDQLNFSTSYNFLADSLKMKNVGVTASTNLFNKINISGNATFDPYAIDYKGKQYNKFAIEAGQGLLRLTNASASASFSLSGKGHIDGNDMQEGSTGSATEYYNRIYYHPVTGEYIPGGWVYYMNPNVPWSINVSYSFSYAKSYNYANEVLTQNNKFTQTLNLSGNVKLSPRMSINAQGGYDIMAMKITTTQISATYDLHCFNIQLSWVPLGKWQSYSFKIAANASTLADILRYRKSSSYWDN